MYIEESSESVSHESVSPEHNTVDLSLEDTASADWNEGGSSELTEAGLEATAGLVPATWLELRVVAPLDASEAVGAYLWEQGAQGVSEEAAARAGEPWALLRAWLTHDDPEQLRTATLDYVRALEEIFPGACFSRVSISPVEQRDWNAAWKEHFKPLRVSPRLVIRPIWEAYSPLVGDVVVDLDPGMAFGTGAHESTQGCLALLDGLFSGAYSGALEPEVGQGGAPLLDCSSRPGLRVLDVGTGSGILLAAALKLGAGAGVGVDIDPLAVEAATRNLELNGYSGQVDISETLLQDVPGTFPIVLANILAPTLIELSQSLHAHLEQPGILVLSGLLHDQAAGVVAAFEALGMRLRLTHRLGEWSTLLLTGPS